MLSHLCGLITHTVCICFPCVTGLHVHSIYTHLYIYIYMTYIYIHIWFRYSRRIRSRDMIGCKQYQHLYRNTNISKQEIYLNQCVNPHTCPFKYEGLRAKSNCRGQGEVIKAHSHFGMTLLSLPLNHPSGTKIFTYRWFVMSMNISCDVLGV